MGWGEAENLPGNWRKIHASSFLPPEEGSRCEGWREVVWALRVIEPWTSGSFHIAHSSPLLFRKHLFIIYISIPTSLTQQLAQHPACFLHSTFITFNKRCLFLCGCFHLSSPLGHKLHEDRHRAHFFLLMYPQFPKWCQEPWAILGAQYFLHESMNNLFSTSGLWARSPIPVAIDWIVSSWKSICWSLNPPMWWMVFGDGNLWKVMSARWGHEGGSSSWD